MKAAILTALVLVIGGSTPGSAAGPEGQAFQGVFNLRQQTLHFEILAERDGASPLQVDLVRTSPPKSRLTVKLDNFRLPFFLISLIVEGEVETRQLMDQSVAVGKVQGRYGLINNKPLVDVVGQFEIRDDRVTFSVVGGDVKLDGSWQLAAPFAVDLTATFTDLPLQDVVGVFDGHPDESFGGMASGRIQVSGPPEKLFVKAIATSYEGRLNFWDYRNMTLKLEGVYPFLRVYDSVATQTDGLTFRVAGAIDLSQPAQLARQIDTLDKQPMIRSNSRELEWTLKRLETEDGKGSTELKYLRRQKMDVHTLSEEDTDLIGVQQKVRF